MEYLLVKYIHIVSATILFGTGIGSAFYMFVANNSKNQQWIYFATKHVVLADWLFTTPAAIIQLVTGLWLMKIMQYRFSDLWLMWALVLFIMSMSAWVVVVFLQLKMLELAKKSYEEGSELPRIFWVMNYSWISLGAVAFPMMLIIFFLMVFKPLT